VGIPVALFTAMSSIAEIQPCHSSARGRFASSWFCLHCALCKPQWINQQYSRWNDLGSLDGADGTWMTGAVGTNMHLADRGVQI